MNSVGRESQNTSKYPLQRNTSKFVNYMYSNIHKQNCWLDTIIDKRYMYYISTITVCLGFPGEYSLVSSDMHSLSDSLSLSVTHKISKEPLAQLTHTVCSSSTVHINILELSTVQ